MYQKDAIDADGLRGWRSLIAERLTRLQEQAEALQGKLNALALSEQQAQGLVKYPERLARDIVESRVERIVKAVESMLSGRVCDDDDDDLDPKDEELAYRLMEAWENEDRRHRSLSFIRDEVMEHVLEPQTGQLSEQLNCMSIPEKQALLDQLGVLASWRRGQRVTVYGNFALDYLIEERTLPLSPR